MDEVEEQSKKRVRIEVLEEKDTDEQPEETLRKAFQERNLNTDDIETRSRIIR